MSEEETLKSTNSNPEKIQYDRKVAGKRLSQRCMRKY